MISKSFLGLVCVFAFFGLMGVFAYEYFPDELEPPTRPFSAKKLPPYSPELTTNYYDIVDLIDSGSVLVMDAVSGRVFFEIDGFTRRYPASITKIMTAIVVLENVNDLDEMVSFSHNAVNLPWYAARMWMVYGETLSVRDILYGLMLSSGNDLARAVAEHVSGSVDAFVYEMNRRAVEMGAYNTRFVNPCGLPGDNQYTTAFDISLIMKEAIQIPYFVEIISTAYYGFPATYERPEGRVINNTHRMIRQYFEYEYDPRIVGGKTGFTIAAQHTLVSYAKYDDFSLIISVLFSPNRTIFTDTRLLMDHVFGVLSFERDEEIRIEQERIEQERLALAVQTEQETNGNLDQASKYLPLIPIYISDTEALAIAASSLGLAMLSLGVIKFIYSRKDN